MYLNNSNVLLSNRNHHKMTPDHLFILWLLTFQKQDINKTMLPHQVGTQREILFFQCQELPLHWTCNHLSLSWVTIPPWHFETRHFHASCASWNQSSVRFLIGEWKLKWLTDNQTVSCRENSSCRKTSRASWRSSLTTTCIDKKHQSWLFSNMPPVQT